MFTQSSPTCVLMVAGLLLLAIGQASAAEPSTKPDKCLYAPTFEGAARPALLALPPGAIEPQGWLGDWCITARDGYTGHMDDVHPAFKQAWAVDYKMMGDKLFWPNGGWPYEGGGYWFDGLARLGFALHDESLVNQAKKRLDVVIDNMNDNGILFLWWLDKNNPEHLRAGEGRHYGNCEWPVWSCGLLGRAMVGYYAGSRDPRALKALEKAYSNYTGWATMECWGVSNIWPAYQTYRYTGNKTIRQALTDFFAKPGDEKKNESYQRYRRMPNPASDKPDHVVHFMETTAAAAVGYLWTGKQEYLDCVLAWYDLVNRECMQPFGVIVADEFYGPTGAFRSTETCDVSASIWSQILLLSITGRGDLADRVERAFFNAGPAAVSRDFKMHAYFQSPNRMADRSLPKPGQCTFSPTHNPLCCTAAANRFLPHYVTHMWMATPDNGLAAVHYGPCRLSALAGNGVKVQIDCRTDYPFNESIEMTVRPQKDVAFPLSLRVPSWCGKPVIRVNGAAASASPDAKGFVRIDRSWKDGDTIRLQFPMEVQVATGTDRNLKPAAPYATVSYGPLLFALPIAEGKDINTPDPAARWKYALHTAGENMAAEVTIDRGPMPAKWDWPLESPLKLRVPAISFDWKPKHEAALPTAPVPATGEVSKITLVPYGCTKLRVSMFPVTEPTGAKAATSKPAGSQR